MKVSIDYIYVPNYSLVPAIFLSVSRYQGENLIKHKWWDKQYKQKLKRIQYSISKKIRTIW
jgi:hypothetical protein